MIIDRLVLENFKRFKSQEIRFHDGITGILGNNGTGKSSIVQAIFFALYGVQGTGIASDYLISSFASPRELCSVRLDFRIGGEAYTIVRTLKKGKTVQHDANLHKGRLKLATGVIPVDKEVRKILGMGPVDFRNTIYAAQKDLLTLLESTPGKRKEWFLRALGIDHLNSESQKILKEQVDNQERESRLAEGELKGMKDRRNPQDLPLLEETMHSIQETLSSLASRQTQQNAEKDQLVADLTRYREGKTEHTRMVERRWSSLKEIDDLVLQKELIGKQLQDLVERGKEFQDLQHDLSSYPDKKREQKILREHKTEFDQLSAEYRFAEKEIAELHDRVKNLEMRQIALDKDAATMLTLGESIRARTGIGKEVSDAMLEQAFASRQAEIQHAIGMLSEKQDNLVAEWKKLVADYEAIKNAGPEGICPLCGQTLGEHYAQIGGEFATRIEFIQNQAMLVCEEQDRIAIERDCFSREMSHLQEMRSLAERLETRNVLEGELHNLHVVLLQREHERQRLAESVRKLSFDTAHYNRIESEIADLEKKQQRYVDLSREVGTGTALRQQLTDLEIKIEKKREELTELASLIARSSFDPEKEAKLGVRTMEMDSAIRKTAEEIARKEERLLHTKERIEENKKAGQQIVLLKERIAELKEDTDLLRLTRSFIGDYVLYLMQVVRNRLEAEVSRIVTDITSGRYEQVLLDEDFNILVRDIDDDYPVDRFSGGEQDDIAVALRIALSRYLAELHQMQESTLLIFDEIFGSQDEERRSNLLTALRTQESRFPQIILISHISEIQGEFTNALMVEMGTDLTSTVREVQEFA